MGTYLLRGITTALLVTVLTLFAGMVWGAMGLGGLSASRLLDIGLFASCLVGGYRTAKESGEWWLGGATGAGYVAVGTLLLALFLPIRGWGFIQVLAEGATIGLVAGAIGAGGTKGVVSGAWQGKRSRSYFKPSYASGDSEDHASCEFNWNKEKDSQEGGYPTTANWLECSERELHDPRWAKKDSEETTEVKWSWDSEDDKLTSLGSGKAKPLIASGPEWVGSDAGWSDVGWNDVTKNEVAKNEVSDRNRRTSLRNVNENKESGTRPWWED
ncbi:MAG: YrzE family protein [Desulfosporosinus sp.]|nr:YrzE family protein [Desulfosporosinus sp.]